MKKFQTLAAVLTCVATLAFATSASAMSPNVSMAKTAGQHIDAIAGHAGFAIIEFEVGSESQVISPFGEDVEMDEAHATQMVAMNSNLASCIRNCYNTYTDPEDIKICEHACWMAFPNGRVGK